MNTIQKQIENKITQALKPQHLSVINESNKHNVPAGSESHFKVIIVAEEFNNCTLIDRHRKINELLAAELASDIHALSLRTLTPEEWQRSEGEVTETPPCMGGDKGKSSDNIS